MVLWLSLASYLWSRVKSWFILVFKFQIILDLKFNKRIPWIIKIKKSFGISRDDLFNKLLSEGIRTSVHYKPLHKFTMFTKKGKIHDDTVNSEEAYSEIISLPMYPNITKKEQDAVIQTIKNSK